MSAAAILPLLLLAVAAIEIARVIAAYRRAVRLNRALHELRRPLQSISLSIEGRDPDLICAHACLEQARGALEELDAAVNRRVLARRPVPTVLAQITGALEDRWRFAGVRVVTAPGGERPVDADPVVLGAALDNLVANAIEHGGGEVGVAALCSPTAVRFEIRDGGPGQAQPGRRGAGRPQPRSDGSPEPRSGAADARRGHGLAIAAAAAAEYGGSLVPPTPLAGGGTVAALSLPAPADPDQRPSR